MTPEIKKALDLALDRAVPSILSPGWVMIPDKDFDAIKQARSAPVQEPVAWLFKDDWGRTKIAFSKETANEWGTEVQPLYATPPEAQRQWVGLPDDEIEEMANDFEEGYVFLYRSFARAIEAAHGITAAAPEKGQP